MSKDVKRQGKNETKTVISLKTSDNNHFGGGALLKG